MKKSKLVLILVVTALLLSECDLNLGKSLPNKSAT